MVNEKDHQLFLFQGLDFLQLLEVLLAQELPFFHFDHDADEFFHKKVLEFNFHTEFIFLQVGECVCAQKFVEELRQKRGAIFIFTFLQESALAMNIIEKAVVIEDYHQLRFILLSCKVVLKQIQDVPDLPEPTLFLYSLQVQFGDDITD